MSFEFHIITGETVHRYLENYNYEVFDLIKNVYLMHHLGETSNPNSHFLRFSKKEKMRIIALPAYVGGDYSVPGIKWIASNPDNITNGIPRASAVIILNDYATGYPIACIEAALISATRTAHSAILAAQYIKKGIKKINSLGLVGTGVLAKHTLITMQKLGWDIEHIQLYDLNIESAEKFRQGKEINLSINAEIMPEVDQLIKSCDVTIFTTTASSPYIFNIELFKHNPIILNISLRDLSPDILLNANNIVDDIHHVLTAHTSPHLTYQMAGHHHFINGTLAGLIHGDFELDDNKASIFSPMGLGSLDIALGKFIYDKAIEAGVAQTINNFFYES